MITIDELKMQLGEHEHEVRELGDALAITASEKRVAELENKMTMPGFYDDTEASARVFAEMSALKGEGSMKVAEKAIALAKAGQNAELPHVFTGSVEHAVAHIEESIQGRVEERYLRWYAIKLFERDGRVLEELKQGRTTAEIYQFSKIL